MLGKAENDFTPHLIAGTERKKMFYKQAKALFPMKYRTLV